MVVLAPSPAWDAGRFGVNARARHCMGVYGLSARAAAMKTCFIGCADASSTLTRRVLRTTAAPILPDTGSGKRIARSAANLSIYDYFRGTT